MHITQPLGLVTFNPDDDTCKFLVQSYKSTRELTIKHISSYPSEKLSAEARNYILETTGIDINYDDFNLMLACYPAVKASLLEYGINDTDVEGQLLNMLVHYLYSASWPIFGDGLTDDQMKTYIKNLQHIAIEFGFGVRENDER